MSERRFRNLHRAASSRFAGRLLNEFRGQICFLKRGEGWWGGTQLFQGLGIFVGGLQCKIWGESI